MKETSTKVIVALVGTMLAGIGWFLLDLQMDVKENNRVVNEIAFNQSLILHEMNISAGFNPFSKENIDAP